MKKIILSLCLYSLFIACSKQQEWLDVRINRSSVVLKTLDDYQALLDADYMFREYGFLGILGSDQINLTDADYNAVNISTERNGYIWAKEIYEGRMPSEWLTHYRIIAVANICLEGLGKIPMTPQNERQWKQIQGAALFFRGLANYQLLQYFAAPYDSLKAHSDLGIPLRFSSDVNDKPGRSSVQQCYEQVLQDLQQAVALLPENTSPAMRPSKVAALGLLSRIYLLMGNWTSAEQLSGQALAIRSTILDYNSVNAAASLPFPTLQNQHPEVLFYAEGAVSNYFVSNRPLFDTLLYRSYANNDLRRTVFFRLFNNQPIFKGFYTGRNMVAFAGVAVNELFLIRAESLARLGQTSAAMATLNSLLIKRWRTGSFVPLSATGPDDALVKILTERRKELAFTGSLVWEDLRRLNRDPRFAKTLIRRLNGNTYSLPPNDPRYVLPIPEIEIQLTGIAQNIR